MIDNELSKNNLSNEEKIRYSLLKVSILSTMGMYKGIMVMFEELIEEITNLNLPIEYLKANLIKIDTLQRLSQREECLKLITEMEAYLEVHKVIPLKKLEKIKSAILYHKGDHYWRIGKPDIALKYLTQSMEKVKASNDQELLGMLYNRFGAVYNHKGMYDEALNNFKMSLDIQLHLMNKRELSTVYNNIGHVCLMLGEYDIALECYENSIRFGEEIGNKPDLGVSILNVGMLFLYLGNHDKALKNLKNALTLNEEANNYRHTSSSLYFIIQLLLETQAPTTEVNIYLKKLEMLYRKSQSNFVFDRYMISKGLILKSSKRLAEKIEAQKYFNLVVKSESSRFDLVSEAILNLIEVLLLELKSTESTEILTAIENLTQKLLNDAKRQNIYPILIKTYLLQSKLALLQLEIDKAKEFLEKASKLADEKKLNKLSLAIMKEQKELTEKLTFWKVLVDKKSSYLERVELAQIENTIIQMTNHRLELTDDIESLFKEFSIDKLSLLAFRFENTGVQFHKGINIPESATINRDLIYMSTNFMIVLGQGQDYHKGLYGPFPVPIPGYSAIVFSLMMNDRQQSDPRMKGQTYSLFCILYPQLFSVCFFKREAITKIFQNRISELTDLTDLTEEFLLELRKEVYNKITEVFTSTHILETTQEVISNN